MIRIPNVLVYLDDILVTGHTQEQHFSNLHKVLLCFHQAGLHLKKQKCQFLVKSVDYLGYTIDQKGIHPFEGRVEAVKAAPNPKNLTELNFMFTCLAGTLPFALTTNLCRAFSMNPSQCLHGICAYTEMGTHPRFI